MDTKLAFVIAHYHEGGRVPANLFNLIEHVRTLTPRVIVVSTGISKREKERLSRRVKVIARENVGYDFWSYKLGIDDLGDRSDLERLVLLNSSFITLDPQKFCEAFLTPVAWPSLRGLTCTAQRGWHAQTYCVSFDTNELLQSSEFAGWWASLTPISQRTEVILKQEVQMSQWFGERGVVVQPVFIPSAEDQLVAICRIMGSRLLKVSVPANADNVTVDLGLAYQLNPSHLLWDSVLERFHLIKIDLLKNNPTFQYLNYFLESLSRTKPELFHLIRDAVPRLRLSDNHSHFLANHQGASIVRP